MTDKNKLQILFRKRKEIPIWTSATLAIPV